LLTAYVGEKGAGLLFWQICGSTLAGTYDGKIHGVTLGCVNGNPAVELDMHVHVGSKAAWEALPPGFRNTYQGPPAKR